MTIILRPGSLPRDSDLVLVHMGAGALDSVRNAAIRNFASYRDLMPGLSGAFTMSVYGTGHGVDIERLVAALPHKQFGTARFEEVRQDFEVWPTTILDQDSEYPDWLQRQHYDVVLASGAPDDIDPRYMNQRQLERLTAYLEDPANRALAHFAPRQGKIQLRAAGQSRGFGDRGIGKD